MRIPKLLKSKFNRLLIIEIFILGFLLLLIFNIYAWWIAALLLVIVALLIYARFSSTLVFPHPTSPVFIIKELIMKLDFKDATGELVHVTKEQLIKPYKSIAKEYIDRGLAATGEIKNFKSFLFIDDNWKKANISSHTVEGAEISVTTTFDLPLSDKVCTKRKLEFDVINSFKEKEESFLYRVDNPTEFYKVTFNFDINRKPEQMTIYEVIGGYRRNLEKIRSSQDKSEVFKWEIKKPHFGSNYLFIWSW
jgi:hypothetical protein